MTQCTIDGHKDCKCSNYFYEMQHYGYINFCKNLVYLYDTLKRCQNKTLKPTKRFIQDVLLCDLFSFYFSIQSCHMST